MLKKMLNKLLDHINSETEVDESRRRVVKGIAGLAALAAVGANINLGHPIVSQSEFDRMALNGVIENVTFYLDRTLLLENMQGLKIINCKFIALDGFEGDYMMKLSNSSCLSISCCSFDARSIATTCISFI